MLSFFSSVQLLVTLWTVALQAPLPWDSPGKNTGVGCHALLQEIFPTQGSSTCLLHWQADSLPVRHLGSPLKQLNPTEVRIERSAYHGKKGMFSTSRHVR